MRFRRRMGPGLIGGQSLMGPRRGFGRRRGGGLIGIIILAIIAFVFMRARH